MAWLRSEALKSPDVKPEQFAIVVRDIPPVPGGQTRKEQVDTYFKAIYPETFYRSMIVTDNKEVRCSFDFPFFVPSVSPSLSFQFLIAVAFRNLRDNAECLMILSL